MRALQKRTEPKALLVDFFPARKEPASPRTPRAQLVAASLRTPRRLPRLVFDCDCT